MIPTDILFVCECSPMLKIGSAISESMRVLADETVAELPQGCRVGILNYSNSPGAVKWAQQPSRFEPMRMFDRPCGMPNLYHALNELPQQCVDSLHLIVVVLTYCGASDDSRLLSGEAMSFLRTRCTGAVVYGDEGLQCNMLAFPVDNSATFQAGKVSDSDRFRMFVKSTLSRELKPLADTLVSDKSADRPVEKTELNKRNPMSEDNEDPFA